MSTPRRTKTIPPALHSSDVAESLVPPTPKLAMPPPELTPNGEVEGPADHVSKARRARNIDRVPPRPTTDASRTPPTIVSGR